MGTSEAGEFALFLVDLSISPDLKHGSLLRGGIVGRT
jgi:hypothetical protein